jgi:hypothetical protein
MGWCQWTFSVRGTHSLKSIDRSNLTMRTEITATALLSMLAIASSAAAEAALKTEQSVEQTQGSAPERPVATQDERDPQPREEQLFSGPQVGEKLPPLPVRGAFDEDAGKERDFVTAAGGKPLVLIFVHELNRPTVGMARAVGNYARSRAKDGLASGIVWLDDDATEAENTLKRIRHALPQEVPVGISLDGKEGPGSYGLNRNVALTILVGNDGTVTDNFALVQPSLQVDLPKVVAAIVRQVGGTVPPLSELVERTAMMRGVRPDGAESPLRDLIRPVIRRNATDAAVDRAAAAVESYVEENAAARAEVGRISKTIVESGKLSNYGTPRAQEHLRNWAEKYGGQAQEDSSEPSPEAASR